MWDGSGFSITPDSDIDAPLQSCSSASNQFGFVITNHAFNADDVDFKVKYTQLLLLTIKMVMEVI